MNAVLADGAQTVLTGSVALAIPFALLAGVVSFFSPCVLPLVPVYISYVTGLTGAQLNGEWAIDETLPRSIRSAASLAKPSAASRDAPDHPEAWRSTPMNESVRSPRASRDTKA